MTSTNRNGIRRPFDTERKSNFTMRLIKLAVCILVIVTKICSAGSIVKTSKVNESSLIETLIDILESCYTDRFSTVGVAGPSAGRIMTKMSLRDPPIPVALVDETAGFECVKEVDPGSRYRLQVFVITSSNMSLYDTLVQVRYSKWWNHMASFFLIDSNDSENGCSNAVEILFEAWKLDLLNSKFVCLHQTRGRLIYTFNPYTNKAPNPWRQEDIREGINGHPWTLFVREYREDESDCYELDFDKTVDVGGYEVRAKHLESWWSPNESFTPWLSNRRINVTAQILMDSLNASWKVRSCEDETSCTSTYVDNGVFDIDLGPVVSEAPHVIDFTEWIVEFQIMFMTQYPRKKTQLEKLLSVLDSSSRFGVLVVLMVTLLFFKFWLNRPLVLSIMNIVLLICNAGIQRVPRETASRIYLAGLFILVVTIQGIYSGIFASLLTKDVRLRTIDSVEDLARSGYKIYGAWSIEQWLPDKAFEGRFFEETGGNCKNDLLNDSRLACVDDEFLILDLAEKYKFHVSKESMGHNYASYFIRPDWPLVDRVNKIFRRVKAGGLLKVRYSLEYNAAMRRLESYEKQEDEPYVKVLTLKHLGFAFVILGIGLGCATIIFIIEVATFHTAIANFWNRIRR